MAETIQAEEAAAGRTFTCDFDEASAEEIVFNGSDLYKLVVITDNHQLITYQYLRSRQVSHERAVGEADDHHVHVQQEPHPLADQMRNIREQQRRRWEEAKNSGRLLSTADHTTDHSNGLSGAGAE